ncbi:MAG: cytochrome c maturation protein CcmE [Pseudomonadota bacterium]
MTPRRQRMLFVALIVMGVGTATAFGIKAFQENLEYFYSPSDILAQELPEDRTIRLGGMVEEGSIDRATGSLKVNFVVTDFAKRIAVEYEGVLPDLFTDGQGVVAIGKMNGETFTADKILAKHDESYMPPEVTEALDKAKGGKEY